VRRYENRVVVIPEPFANEVVDALDKLGDDGWRPWHMYNYGNQTWVYLVREIDPDRQADPRSRP
jgi:hypothetical protein